MLLFFFGVAYLMLADQSEVHNFLFGVSKSETIVQELVANAGAFGGFQKWPIVIGGTIEYSLHGLDDRICAEVEVSFNRGQRGHSRVVYMGGLFLVKLAESNCSQHDDNVEEYRVREAMPYWLIPKVYGIFDFDSFGVKGSSLVCKRMNQTVYSFLIGLMSSPPT